MAKRRTERKQAKTDRPRTRGAAKKKPNRKASCGQQLQENSMVDDDPQAQRFFKKYTDHPSLQNDCVYALPIELIKAILSELPEFLSAEDEEFEFDLADSSGSGFFLKRSFQYLLFTNSDAKIRQRQTDVQTTIQRMLAEEMMKNGRTKLQIKRYFQKQHEIDQKLLLRQRSFAGWLVTNPQFRLECRRFWKSIETRIREQRTFWPIPFSFIGGPPTVSEENREFFTTCMSFYMRWNLDTIASWDLPVPMRADVVTRSLYDLDSLRDAGITVFLPWFQSRDRDITLRELAEWHQLSQPPDHLKDWLEHRPDNWGHDRFAMMLRMYVYLELGLKCRYGNRLKGSLPGLDAAFARYFKRTTDSLEAEQYAGSVKKVRQELSRRLKRVDEELSAND